MDKLETWALAYTLKFGVEQLTRPGTTDEEEKFYIQMAADNGYKKAREAYENLCKGDKIPREKWQ